MAVLTIAVLTILSSASFHVDRHFDRHFDRQLCPADGPDKDGEFHPLAVQALELAGDWLAVNGQAIYATRSMPVHWNDTKSDYVRYTRSKDNTTIFAIALTGFGGPDALAVELTLSCVEPVAGSSIYLLGQNASAVKWRQDKATGLTTIQVPAAAASLPGPGYSFKITGKPSDRC